MGIAERTRHTLALMTRRAYLSSVLRVALTHLVYYRRQTALAVGGGAVAVVVFISLSGIGYGAVIESTDAISWFNRELWATTGGVGLTPGTVGAVDNPISNAHERSHEIASHESVTAAQSVAFQAVYVSPHGEEFETIVGVGVGGDAGKLRIARRFTREDRHYANGTYEGPMTGRIVVDSETAAQYNLSVGDTLHVGATILTAKQYEFTVVGVSDKLSGFLGTRTVGMHLSELQEVSGTTGRDPASFVAIRVKPGVNPESVEHELEQTHPGLEVRSDAEQLRSVVREQTPVVVGAVTLIVVAVIVGIALVGNTLALMIAHQRRQLAALRATGVSSVTLAGVVTTQGVIVGGVSGIVGLLAVYPVMSALNAVVRDLTGFSDLVEIPAWLIGAGFLIALGVGTAGATVAGWRVGRLDSLAYEIRLGSKK